MKNLQVGAEFREDRRTNKLIWQSL